jgi:hypothetical protein
VLRWIYYVPNNLEVAMVALVMTQTGTPRVVGQYTNSQGARVWRIWDCSATYDSVSKTWSAVAVKDSRRALSNQAEQHAYSKHWILLAQLEDGDDSPLAPPFFGDIGD